MTCASALGVYREGPLDSGSLEATEFYNYFRVLDTQFIGFMRREDIRVVAVNCAPGRPLACPTFVQNEFSTVLWS